MTYLQMHTELHVLNHFTFIYTQRLLSILFETGHGSTSSDEARIWWEIYNPNPLDGETLPCTYLPEAPRSPTAFTNMHKYSSPPPRFTDPQVNLLDTLVQSLGF